MRLATYLRLVGERLDPTGAAFAADLTTARREGRAEGLRMALAEVERRERLYEHEANNARTLLVRSGASVSAEALRGLVSWLKLRARSA